MSSAMVIHLSSGRIALHFAWFQIVGCRDVEVVAHHVDELDLDDRKEEEDHQVRAGLVDQADRAAWQPSCCDHNRKDCLEALAGCLEEQWRPTVDQVVHLRLQAGRLEDGHPAAEEHCSGSACHSWADRSSAAASEP